MSVHDQRTQSWKQALGLGHVSRRTPSAGASPGVGDPSPSEIVRTMAPCRPCRKVSSPKAIEPPTKQRSWGWCKGGNRASATGAAVVPGLQGLSKSVATRGAVIVGQPQRAAIAGPQRANDDEVGTGASDCAASRRAATVGKPQRAETAQPQRAAMVRPTGGQRSYVPLHASSKDG